MFPRLSLAQGFFVLVWVFFESKATYFLSLTHFLSPNMNPSPCQITLQ